MSDDPSSPRIPTNEEIVDDLLKDIPKRDRDEENQFLPEDLQYESDDASTHDDKEAQEQDPDQENDEKPTNPLDDFVNDEFLKELEDTLSEAEKAQRQSEALELKKEGNKKFSEGEYMESLKIYTQCLNLCPLAHASDRCIYYSNRAACKYQLGHKESAIDDCARAIELNGNFLRAYLRRAKYYEELDKLDEAFSDYKKVLELDPSVTAAKAAVATLPERINVRNEKLKAEMFGKLKDLGNMVLKPFGLSTANFQMVESEGGGYSLNFKK